MNWLAVLSGWRRNSPNSGGLFDVDRRLEEIAALEHQLAAPDFWNDQENAQRVTRQVAQLRAPIEQLEGYQRRLEDLKVMVDLAEEGADAELAAEAQRETDELEQQVHKLELQVLLNGKYDSFNAILSIHAGAGGTEAQDWRRCSSACTCAGPNAAASRWRSWTAWRARRPASSR